MSGTEITSTTYHDTAEAAEAALADARRMLGATLRCATISPPNHDRATHRLDVTAQFSAPNVSPLMAGALASLDAGFRRIAAARRDAAAAHVRLTCGPGKSDHNRMRWESVETGAVHFGTFSEFLAMVECDRFSVEVQLASAYGPHRRVRINGWVLEHDLRPLAMRAS